MNIFLATPTYSLWACSVKYSIDGSTTHVLDLYSLTPPTVVSVAMAFTQCGTTSDSAKTPIVRFLWPVIIVISVCVPWLRVVWCLAATDRITFEPA